MSSTTPNAEHSESIGGGLEIRFGAVAPSKLVDSSGMWNIAFNRLCTATLFIFPHRAKELSRYREHIIGLFAATNPLFHGRIISYDQAVRKRITQRCDLELAAFADFMDIKTAVIDSIGVGVVDAQREPSSGVARKVKAQARNNWNINRCSLGTKALTAPTLSRLPTANRIDLSFLIRLHACLALVSFFAQCVVVVVVSVEHILGGTSTLSTSTITSPYPRKERRGRAEMIEITPTSRRGMTRVVGESPSPTPIIPFSLAVGFSIDRVGLGGRRARREHCYLGVIWIPASSSTSTMFEEAEEFSLGEIKAYRDFAFPDVLGHPAHDPFFSVDTASRWITSLGYQLYLEQDDNKAPSTLLWSFENASTKQLKAYRNYMLSDEYLGHSFFTLEHPETWVSPVAFHVYMETYYGSFEGYQNAHNTPLSSRAPSRAGSAISTGGSRASSRASFAPSSRTGSQFSLPPSEDFSRPPSALSSIQIDAFDNLSRPSSTSSFNHIPSDNFDDPDFPAAPLLPPLSAEHAAPGELVPDTRVVDKPAKGKGKSKKTPVQIQITRQLKVDKIIDLAKVPSTWDVPHSPAAYRINTSNSKELSTVKSGRVLTLDAFIRQEDQDSWGGSAGHSAGDVKVRGLTLDPDEELLCRRAHLFCNGVKTCQFIDPALFAECERYEPDFDAMRELWNHELDANELEAAFMRGS
ncbi:hypothetical protein C8R43DRAFT_1118466 [Mycena crocata]|nr:hypothetical protein C8R43DRAFT_1143648 [Mycena crocata]KAJ7177477.1 hypothetical protein C8R43DRAFT_1118466 [Mycena crocata]